MAKSCYFCRKTLSLMFDWVLNTPLGLPLKFNVSYEQFVIAQHSKKPSNNNNGSSNEYAKQEAYYRSSHQRHPIKKVYDFIKKRDSGTAVFL